MSAPFNDGGPAFPATCSSEGIPLAVSYPASQVSGMSLRDWFAGQALAGMLASGDINLSAVQLKPIALQGIADVAYSIADSMLAAREVKP